MGAPPQGAQDPSLRRFRAELIDLEGNAASAHDEASRPSATARKRRAGAGAGGGGPGRDQAQPVALVVEELLRPGHDPVAATVVGGQRAAPGAEAAG